MPRDELIPHLEKRLSQEAHALFKVLKRNNTKLVFAESCTGGMVAASLARVPGISGFLCGSAVVYREETKAAWLGVSAETLRLFGAVSLETSIELAEQVLKRTPEADVAAAITGHLGPTEHGQLDGQLFISLAWKSKARGKAKLNGISREIFALPLPTHGTKKSSKDLEILRLKRQLLASHEVLFMVRSLLIERSKSASQK